MKLAFVSQWVTSLSTDRKSHLLKARRPGSRESRVLEAQDRRSALAALKDDLAAKLPRAMLQQAGDAGPHVFGFEKRRGNFVYECVRRTDSCV
jgi:hypothetical protein